MLQSFGRSFPDQVLECDHIDVNAIRCQADLVAISNNQAFPGFPRHRIAEDLANMLQRMLQAVSRLDIAPIPP